MRTKRTIGAAAILGLLGASALGGCDIIVGIGIYCTEGKDPGCGGAATGGIGGTGGSGGTTTSATGGMTNSTGGGVTGGGGSGGTPECSPPGATQGCYDGPPATKGVGACTDGVQICQQNGMWGTCDGDVLPGVETCASEKDEDCNKTECALWSELFGDSATQAVLDIAVDSAGDILVLGFFKGELSGVQPPLTSAGSNDLFLLKMKPTGEMVWAKQWGDVNDQSRGRMAVDGVGNIVIAGSYQGTLDFGPSYVLPPKGADDIYVAKLSGNGDTIWAKGIGDSKTQIAWDVAVDSLGDIVVVGGFAGTVDFGDGNVSAAGLNLSDAFVMKIAGNGALSWKKTMGDAMAQQADSVSVNVGGDVLLTGPYQGMIVFGGTTLSNAGQRFVATFSAAGTNKWAKSFPVWSANTAAAGDGTWWLAGSVIDPVDFGGGILTPGGGYDIFVAKLDSNGAYVDAKRFGGSGSESISDIVVDSAGDLVFTGMTDSGVDFGAGPLITAGSTDMLVAKFHESLDLAWARRFGDDQQQGFGHVATDATNFIYLGGQMSGVVDFGAGAQTSNGSDVVVVKLAP